MKIKNGIMLVLTAFIWGTAFVESSILRQEKQDLSLRFTS